MFTCGEGEIWCSGTDDVCEFSLSMLHKGVTFWKKNEFERISDVTISERSFTIYNVEPKIRPHAGFLMIWGRNCPLKAAQLLAVSFHFCIVSFVY